MAELIDFDILNNVTIVRSYQWSVLTVYRGTYHIIGPNTEVQNSW